MSEKASQGCAGFFSRMTPKTESEVGSKLRPGIALPHITLPTTEGGRVEIGAPSGRWQLIVAYRGKHDPLDLTYLAALQHLMPEFEELSVDVVAVSADTRSKACAFVDDLRGAVLAVSPDTKAGRILFKVAYGMNEQQMRRWGVYVSRPLSPDESINLFCEPAIFLVNPAGLIHVMVYSNATFARPDLKQIVQGIKMVQDQKMPIRGTY